MIEPSVRADATVVCLLARHAGRLPLLVFALQYKHHCCLIQICVTVKYWCAILVCNTCATSCFCPSFTSPVTCSQLISTSAWKPLVTTPDNCYCVCKNATVHSLVYTTLVLLVEYVPDCTLACHWARGQKAASGSPAMQSSWRRPKLGISVNEKNYFLLSKNHHFLHGEILGASFFLGYYSP